MNFHLSDDQRAKVEEWLKTVPVPPNTAIGGALTYSFTPTELGTVVKVIAWNGSELDVSDYDYW